MGQPLEEVARLRRMRVHLGRDVVLAPDLHRVEAKPAGRMIHHCLHHRERDWMADGAVLAHRRLVLKDHAKARGIVAEAVDARRKADGLVVLDGAGPRIDGVGADAGQVVHPHAEDGPVSLDGQLGLHAVLTRVNIAHEGLEPVGGELDRPAEHHAERARRHLVRVDVDLDPEAPAHVLADDADVLLGQPEVARQDVLHHVGRLERVIHRQPPLRRIEVGQDGARFEGHARVPAHDERIGQDGVGVLEGCIHITRAEIEPEGEVVAELGVNDGRRRVERALGIRHDRQRLPLDAHARHAVLGQRATLRHHGRDGLALPGSFAGREGPLHRRLHPLEVGKRADPARADGCHVFARDDGGHSGQRPRLGGVYRNDPRVRVRAPHEGNVEHPRQRHVIGEDAAASQESRRLGPDHALADVAPALFDVDHARVRSWAVLRIASTMA